MSFLIRYKKIFLAAGFVVFVVFAGYFLYATFFRQAAPAEKIGEKQATTTTGGLPVSPVGPGQIITPKEGEKLPAEETPKKEADATASGGLTRVTELTRESGLGVTLSSNGSDLQYYNKSDGKFYRVNNNGDVSALTDKVFHDVEKIVWSPNKNKAILEYPDGANIVYDLSTNKQVTLPTHWKDFGFSPDGEKIVMKSMGLNPDNRWLAVANEDGSKARRIELLGEKDETVYPSWSPNNQSVAMYTEGVDFNRQEVFFVGLNDENFKSTVIEGRGFEYKWAPKGDRLLYSVYSTDNNLKPMLWTVNAEGESIGSGRKSLNVETWAHKCVFSGSYSLYCAVPEKLDEGAGLFPELALSSRDQLYQIDTRTGIKKLVAIPDGSFNISGPIVSENGYYLYFTDETTKKIYKIKLK